MGLKFQCKTCGVGIMVRFLKVGEAAECKNCGATNPVPESAETIDDETATSYQSRPRRPVVRTQEEEIGDQYLARAYRLARQPTVTPARKKKGVILTVLLGTTPFGMLYLGGMRIGLPVVLCASIFPFVLLPFNLDYAVLPDILRLPITAIMSAVYLYHSLLYRCLNNWVADGNRPEELPWKLWENKEEGIRLAVKEAQLMSVLESKEFLKSYRWGWFFCVSIFHGIVLFYCGAIVLWADLSRSGMVTTFSLTKAVIIATFALFILNKALTWVNFRLKRLILTVEEYAAYTLASIYSGCYKFAFWSKYTAPR